MDAWLPEYINSSNGTSIVLTRKPSLSSLYRELKVIDVGLVVLSQKDVIAKKRVYVRVNLFIRNMLRGRNMPIKRVQPHWLRPWPLVRHFCQNETWDKTRKFFRYPDYVLQLATGPYRLILFLLVVLLGKAPK